MPDDLRTLAQAVVDAWAALGESPAAYHAACRRLADALGSAWIREVDDVMAHAILAALDAADAQGYARAMGEVVERCEAPRRRLARRAGRPCGVGPRATTGCEARLRTQ